MEDKIKFFNEKINTFATFCETVISMPDPNLSKGYLEGKNQTITMLWSKIDKNYDEIMQMMGVSESESEQIRMSYNRAFNMLDKVTVKIHKKLEKFNTVASSQTRSLQFPENVVFSLNKANLKLKPIEIPTFSGEYKCWISFKNMFDSLIHNNADLSDLQKIHYLKTCLAGEAERLISQFDVTDQSYKPAYDLLSERYQNDVVLVDTHIITILAQPELKTESSDGIKELMDVTMENLRALKGLNINTSTWDPILLLLLVQKLDVDSRSLWEQTLKPKTRPTIDEFMEFLSTRFHALGCQKFKFSLESAATKTQHRNNGLQYTHNSSQTCPVCHATNHSIFSCETFRRSNHRTRLEMVASANLCKRCLRCHKTGCTQEEGCRVCGQDHHTFIHDRDNVEV